MSNEWNNPARKRIEKLLDEHSFVELGALVTARSTDFDLNHEQTPSDGVIIGHGLIDDSLVFVFSQDASVLQGTIGEMHAKKITTVYDMAMKMGAPVIGMLDCAGVRLQESVDALESMGSIYAKATEASGVVPQIMGVFGTCGGGLSILPAISDFTFMSDQGSLFLHTPDAIEGNKKELLDTAGAQFQYTEAGNVDLIGTEEEVLDEMRRILQILPGNNLEGGCVEECLDDLNRAADLESKIGNTAEFAREISDNHIMVETKAGYAPSMFTGFIKLNGRTVGVVGNRTVCSDGKEDRTCGDVLTAEGCEKAAAFVNFCDAFDIPLLSLTNTKGYEASVAAEKRLAKAVASLVYAFSGATVPKIGLVVGQAVGSAYLAMNAKSLGADLVYAYEEAHVMPMDAELAAKVMYDGEAPEIIAQKAADFDAKNCGVGNAARRGYVDRVVAPIDTRKYLIAGYEMLLTKRVGEPYKKHGTK